MTKCNKPPFFRYTWPGQDEAMICMDHAFRLEEIAEAMGLYVQLIPLTSEQFLNGECSQEVRDDPQTNP